MATPQVKDLVLHSPSGSHEVLTFSWPLQVGSGQDKHDNGIDIIDTIKFVCDELPGICSAFEEINLNQIDTACFKTMTNLVDRFNKAVDSIVALEKGTSLPTERLNKFAHPSLLRHILQLVYNAAVLDPDKLNNYEPFSPEVYGETSYELVQQMIKHVSVTNDDTFIDLGSGVGQVVLQMAGSFPLKTCVGIEKADTPVRYAERMDLFFRQFMAWFGKRYCDYRLIKGDFLVDEHREKITSSTLVFVNNFAFGPHVDHQLKERFADLRDGARIVSSKSFCPLNFRITDRNLSDIGTIMHLSEIPPLKGSVSWTCKPVSYYLHVIDRTILERYFQRLKTQKGAENDHVGSTRTTRDRAKREANNHAALHHNSNSNQSTTMQRTNSPAILNNHATSGVVVTKTRQQQQLLQQRQQQRSLDLETSTESDGDAATTNGGGSNSTAGGTTNGISGGTTTRKAWSDWCSSKEKSSPSEDEENNNFSSTTNSRNARATAQKKRKKLTRKAAIASKSAAAAQRVQAARDREAAAVLGSSSKDAFAKDDLSTGATTGGRGGGRKGRMKKAVGPGRGKKSLKITGLDVLHRETVRSTSAEASQKMPAADGCLEQQLTSLLTEDMAHKELEIPLQPRNTPYGLQILLDIFRSQYMAMIEQMKSNPFTAFVKRQIQVEQERKQRIKNRASQLDKQIKVLIDDSVALLKVRMNELGINVSSPNDLIAKAKEIVGRHKELQGIAKKIQSQVTSCEVEQKRLLKKHLQPLSEYQKLFENGKTKLECVNGVGAPTHDLSEDGAHELILREIANTLAQRKRLYAQVSNIEKEATALEQTVEDRRTAAALLAQGTNMTLANSQPTAATNTSAMQPVQLNASISVGAASGGTLPAKFATNHGPKSSRRNRDHRTRSQEWPDVPDVGKIEESNPEVLAQKILETGRQIEAGKFTGTTNYGSKHSIQQHEEQRRQKYQRSAGSEPFAAVNGAAIPVGPHDSALMPAPSLGKHQVAPQTAAAAPAMAPKCERKSSVSIGSNSIQESPKVANFEDRLKSIITSALNEDQEQRKATQHQPASTGLPHEVSPAPSAQHSPAPKRSKHSTSASTPATPHLLPPQATPAPNNLSNIINVATQGLTHLNATTTISPVTPPLAAAVGPYAASQHYKKYGKQHQQPQQSSSSSSSVSASAQKYGSNADPSSSKYHHNHPPPQSTAQQQQQQHLSHMQQMHQNAMQQFAAAAAAAGGMPSELAYQRGRNSISAASSYENFASSQQQQQAMMLAAAAAAAAAQQQQTMHPGGMLPMEFKAPSVAENMQRSSSRDMLLDEVGSVPRSSSANSDSSVMYFAPAHDRLMSMERCTSGESAASQPLPPHQHHPYQQPQPSRPSSNSSQPDYTQVSPAKMALRRHLSQEKLNQQHPAPNAAAPMSTKTIGDLVNGEIERTLEISHQSIINAVVNMSTVAANGSGNGSNNAIYDRNSYADRGSLYAERERERQNERPHDRLLINPNAQRPERVHVRVLDESTAEAQHPSGNNNTYSGAELSSRSARSDTHNLSTLAHVAYNHKSGGGHDASGPGAIGMKMMPSACTPAATRSNFNHRDSMAPYHHLPSSSGSTAPAAPPAASPVGALSRAPTATTTRRDYQAVALPRAEMKGCIEAYFSEEQQHHQHQFQPKPTKERSGVRNGRINGSNPPLEGLAASLQDHVMASRKFKEEHEERQRRAAVAASTSADTTQNHFPPSQHGNAMQQHHPLHYQSAAGLGSGLTPNSTLNHSSNPVKAEIGLKRTSPVVAQHPRPSKLPHYSHETLLQHPNSVNATQQRHLQQHHYHQQQQQQQQQQLHNVMSSASSAAAVHHAAMITAHNPFAHINGSSAAVHSTSSTGFSNNANGRRSTKMPLEPLLMSPEINSIMSDDGRGGALQISSSSPSSSTLRQQQRATPTVGGRAGDDDDVIADDETHWQHRVSSGFDRLVAFASTELDKTRRSIDTDTVPSSISCNTSPDSGITHSSSNSDAVRTFLSTSSTCSQLEMPLGSTGGGGGGGSSSSYSSSGYHSLHHHHNSSHHHHDHLSDSSIKSLHSDAGSSCAIALKTASTLSPADASAIDSPPLSDVGLPRTPSPSAIVVTPPLLTAAKESNGAAAAVAVDSVESLSRLSESGNNNNNNSINNNNNNTLKIPLKYQRKSKSSSEKHYKKKFCERNWEYDCDELMAYSSSSSTAPADAAGHADGGVAALEQQEQHLKVTGKSPKQAEGSTVASSNEATHLLNNNHHQNHNHKSSKFRPKGKDWDWSLDSGTKNKTSISRAEAATANIK